MSVEQLREWLGINPGTLERTCDLTKRVIEQARQELNLKASLTFNPKLLREGRKTAGWFFEIKDNKPRRKKKGVGSVELLTQRSKEDRWPGYDFCCAVPKSV